MNKLIKYKDFVETIIRLKQQNQKLVLTGGCFDILHPGHISFLKSAKKSGLVLIALESDESVTKLKGANRPINSQLIRAEKLAELSAVDDVILLPLFNNDSDYDKLIQIIKPDFIAITQEDPKTFQKQSQAQQINAKLIIIPKINTPSTSQLLQKHADLIENYIDIKTIKATNYKKGKDFNKTVKELGI